MNAMFAARESPTVPMTAPPPILMVLPLTTISARNCGNQADSWRVVLARQIALLPAASIRLPEMVTVWELLMAICAPYQHDLRCPCSAVLLLRIVLLRITAFQEIS